MEALLKLRKERGPLYESADEQQLASAVQEATNPNCSDFRAVRALLRWFSCARCVTTFFQMNVHSSLSSNAIAHRFAPIVELATRVGPRVSILVFLDEINTSSCMGRDIQRDRDGQNGQCDYRCSVQPGVIISYSARRTYQTR